MQSAKVFSKKLQELGRQMALVRATIYSPVECLTGSWATSLFWVINSDSMVL